MKESNINGINAVANLSTDNTHKVNNIQARYVLNKLLEKTENPNVETLSSDHDLFMHNKRQAMDFFAHFD